MEQHIGNIKQLRKWASQECEPGQMMIEDKMQPLRYSVLSREISLQLLRDFLFYNEQSRSGFHCFQVKVALHLGTHI